MQLPCQIAHWYLIPAMSAELALELKKGGMKQNDIAKALGLTSAAVSQYVKKKRGKEMKLSGEIHKKIAHLAKKIKNGSAAEDDIALEMCALCKAARRSGLACKLHYETSNIPKTCNVCRGKCHA